MASRPVLVRVRRVGAIRRDWAPWLKQHPDYWIALGAGKEIEFPEDQVPLMRGAVEVVIGTTDALIDGIRTRVVKDDKGNTYQAGVLISGPDFVAQEAAQRAIRTEASSKDRLKVAREANEAKKEAELVKSPKLKTEGSPSTDEVSRPKRPKRRKKTSSTVKPKE